MLDHKEQHYLDNVDNEQRLRPNRLPLGWKYLHSSQNNVRLFDYKVVQPHQIRKDLWTYPYCSIEVYLQLFE